jgi:hypothetical protein
MYKKVSSIALMAITISALTGCASIVSGTNQPVSVATGKLTGATCSLENDKGRWYVNNTPGSVVVSRSYGDLRVNCAKNPYTSGEVNIASHTKPMAFGNAIFGGAIGASVDMVDGAAYDYPNNINIPMYKAQAK